MGDLDDDGKADLVVGSPGWNDCAPGASPCHAGALWILFLDADGTVRTEKRLRFPGQTSYYGWSLAGLAPAAAHRVSLALGSASDLRLRSFEVVEVSSTPATLGRRALK